MFLGVGVYKYELERKIILGLISEIRKNSPAIITILIFFLSLNCISCSKEKTINPKPNIILISLDCLRKDHVGCYSNRPDFTPCIDKFSQDGVIFENAFVQIPFTLPSHMSMLTGFYPDVTGLVPKDRILTLKEVINWRGYQKVLNSNISTLAEVLKKNGYQTIGFASSVWLKGDFGFDRGFDIYQLKGAGDFLYAPIINRAVIKWLQNYNPQKGPFFLFLHYYDPHMDSEGEIQNSLPYYSPEKFRKRFAPGADSENWCSPEGKCATEFLFYLENKGIHLDERKRKHLMALYDSGIAYLDTQLRILFEELKRQKVYDNSLIILTSDHGVEFGEHGKYIHNQTYDENIRVPLMIKFPHGLYQGRKVDFFVETVDFLPTILDFLKIEDVQKRQGRSFLPLLAGKSSNQKEKTYIFSRRKTGALRYCIRNREYKLIFNRKTGEVELYNLREDPGETKNLKDSLPEKRKELLTRLRAFLKENDSLAKKYKVQSISSQISKEEEETLKALGYVR